MKTLSSGEVKKAFINSNEVFNEKTPLFLLEDINCAIASIKRNIYSVNYVSETITKKLEPLIINEAKKQLYLISDKSPKFLKNNFHIVYKSIKSSLKTVNDVNWCQFNEEEKDKLIELLVQKQYVLSNSTPFALSKNRKIVLNSIKLDIKSFTFSNPEVLNDIEILKYLIKNNYDLPEDRIRYLNLSVLTDTDIRKYVIDKFFAFSNEKFKNRINEFLESMILRKPLIGNYEEIFDAIARESWETYISTNSNKYANVYLKICNAVEKESYLDSTNVKSLCEVLDEYVQDIKTTLEDYHSIFNSQMSNKIEALEPIKDKIYNYVKLYIRKSKSIFLNNVFKDLEKSLSSFYTLKEKSPIMQKVVYSKQLETFRSLYNSNDKSVCDSIDKIKRKYSSYIEESSIDALIKRILNNTSSVLDFPLNYQDYLNYKKSRKLITRLNMGYIKINGLEVKGYEALIKYDKQTNKYYYCGKTFSLNEIEKFEKYEKKVLLNKRIQKEIIDLIKETKIKNISSEEKPESISFSDKNYELDVNKELESITIAEIVYYINELGTIQFEDDFNYKQMVDILFNKNLFWFISLFSQIYSDSNFNYRIGDFFSKSLLISLTKKLPYIYSLAKSTKIDINTFKKLISIYEVLECVNKENLAIIGLEKTQMLKQEGLELPFEETIRITKELICNMVMKDKCTVPYVCGSVGELRYTTYDAQDINMLFCGIKTNSCFRIGSTDNDFLHYCVLDKNGFVIKITDRFGNFIGRAAGFRNGNIVYINQLRTVYDIKSVYRGTNLLEQEEIINALKKACDDILETSQKNIDEDNKIEHIFITKSYSMNLISSNVSKEVQNCIGKTPMDNESEDWEEFKKNSNLFECPEKNKFSTDYGEYSLICISSIKNPRDLKTSDIIRKDVPALYERTRNPIKMVILNQDSFKTISRIKAINSFKKNIDFEEIPFENGSIVYMGDNWYILTLNNEIIDKCLLNGDKKAKVEYEITLNEIEKSKEKGYQMKLV